MDKTHIELAKEYAAEKGATNAIFQIESLDKMSFPSNTFDLIFLNGVLEHVRREIMQPALAELKRVLKPGGKLLVEFPPWSSPFEPLALARESAWLEVNACEVTFTAPPEVTTVPAIRASEVSSAMTKPSAAPTAALVPSALLALSLNSTNNSDSNHVIQHSHLQDDNRLHNQGRLSLQISYPNSVRDKHLISKHKTLVHSHKDLDHY